MLDSFPSSMNEGIARYILQTLAELAAVSLALALAAVVFGFLAYRSVWQRRNLWICLAIGAGVLALGPPAFVVYEVNR